MSTRQWPDSMRDFARAIQPLADPMQRVRFHGETYRLVGDPMNGGALATDEQYEAGECSFAHLFADGRVMRFGEQIGTRDELEFIDAA